MPPRKRAYRKRPAKKAQAPAKSMKKMVRAVAKQVVHQQLEDKYTSRNLQPAGVPLSKAGDIIASDLQPLLPSITTGTDSWQRIGEKVRPKRMRVDVIVTSNPTLLPAFLATCRFMILEDRANKYDADLPAITAPRLTQLLDIGSNQFAFTGRNQNINERINTRLFKVHCDKKFVISKGYGDRLATLTSTGNAVSALNAPMTIKFSVYVPTPAVLHYAQPGISHPQNFAPFAVLGYAFNESNYAADPTEVTNLRIQYQILTHLDYEDA